MTDPAPQLDPALCRQARLARDARFDGRFFVAVRSTGIYCRPICPAPLPHERHVIYFTSATQAAREGFRPCLRCRPDSAPDSPAWLGSQTTLHRALRLIDEGALEAGSVGALCSRLGIGERYLRQLFQRRFGVPPVQYARYRQCLFAKQLLHQTALPVTEVALASGFRSLRRFNAAFREQIGLPPSVVRRGQASAGPGLTLRLAYRPPYAWTHLRDFLMSRHLPGLEWVGDDHYGRRFHWHEARGAFTAVHEPLHHRFAVTLTLDDLSALPSVVRRIRRVLDLDADTAVIEAHLAETLPGLPLIEGLRLPNAWSLFEAGVRAILGQQVTVTAARGLATRLVDTLGQPAEPAELAEPSGKTSVLPTSPRHFPTPRAIGASDLAFLGMPQARRDTLRRFATWYAEATPTERDDTRQWTALNGIGPWTADYAAMRGGAHPDVWLGGDLGIRKALAAVARDGEILDPNAAAPWRSYLTLQLWSR